MSIDDKIEINDTTATTTNLTTMDEHDKELLIQSENDFRKKQFNSCLKCIEKLFESESNSLNLKLLHNKAICEYSLSSFKNFNDYKQELDTITSMLKINYDDVSSIEDPEYRVLYYNYAILQFYNKNFTKCLIIVEKMYEYNETLDEILSKEVHLLLIHLYLLTYQPLKALNIIDNYEKQYLTNSSVKLKETTTPNENTLSIFKIKAYLQQRSMNLCEKELENQTNQNTLFLKSYHDCVTKNYRKSLENLCLLYKQQPTTNEQLLQASKILINNNISYVYYYTKKFNLSSYFLRRAIQDNNKYLNDIKTIISTKQPTTTLNSLYLRNLNYKHELLYNLGISLLFNKQSQQAFDCFIELLKSTFRYSKNVRLWLRLAECCTMIYQQNEDLFKFNEKIKCVQKSIGMHIYHKIVFSPHISKQPVTQCQVADQQPNATLDFAYICLKNAFYLINNVDASEKLINCCSPSPAITVNEFNRLKCSILTSLSYVGLCLNDYLSTIRFCNLLLNDCKHFISNGNKYLAHNYLAEALLNVDKIGESIENLNATFDLKSSSDISFTNVTDEGDNSLYEWFPTDVNTARGVVSHNLSVSHAIRGEIDLAKKHFFDSVRSFDKQQPASIYYMKIYLDLIEGNRQSLQEVLREHFGNTTLNRNYQPFNNLLTKPSTPVSTTSALTTPPPPQQQQQQPASIPTVPQLPPTSTAAALQQLLSQQQLPAQLMMQQLAQQQQFMNQFNLTQAPFHLNAQLTPPPPGSHLNLTPQQQNALNNLNFSSNAVNQLFQQQVQVQANAAVATNNNNSNPNTANNTNNQTANSFLSALQSRIS